jgi:hypothetical protein
MGNLFNNGAKILKLIVRVRIYDILQEGSIKRNICNETSQSKNVLFLKKNYDNRVKNCQGDGLLVAWENMQ